jgi:SAM-dependent methyltransferase
VSEPVRPAEEAIADFYRDRIRAHGFSYEAQWGDDADWKGDVRFGPLRWLPFAPGDVVVDIGCGTGELAAFLRGAQPDARYVGVDVLPEFVEQTRERHGVEAFVVDGFRDPAALPEADWYVTFGTLNKEWFLEGMPGDGCFDQITRLLADLYGRSRKGVAASLTSAVVDYLKPGVCNVDPAALATELAGLTPHFAIYHGYPLYEFFAAAWRGTR